MTGSRAFSNETPKIPHLVKGRGMSGEVGDLRTDVEAGFYRLEKRTGYPKISRVVGGLGVSLAAVPVDAEIVGEGLIQGQEHASLTLGTGTAQLVVTANRPGEPGNAITVELEDGGAEAILVAGNAITVTLETGVSTANSVKALFDGDDDALALVNVTSGGAGVVAVTAATALAGGEGEGLSVKVNGIEQAVTGATTETSIPMTITDLTGALADDMAALEIESDGVHADSVSLGIEA